MNTSYRLPRAAAASLILFFVSGGPAWPQPREICGVRYISVTELLGRMKASGSHVEGLQPIAGFIVFQEHPNPRTWTFTAPEHPAHPAVACRSLEMAGGRIVVRTRLHCDATKEACDALATDFAKLDDRMNEALRRGQ